MSSNETLVADSQQRMALIGQLLILPEREGSGFGADDELSVHLYELMRAQGSADPMIDLIDLAKSEVESGDQPSSDFERQVNALIIHRVMLLVADMPVEINRTERYNTWLYLLNADFVRNYGQEESLDEALNRVENSFDPELANEIKRIIDPTIKP